MSNTKSVLFVLIAHNHKNCYDNYHVFAVTWKPYCINKSFISNASTDYLYVCFGENTMNASKHFKHCIPGTISLPCLCACKQKTLTLLSSPPLASLCFHTDQRKQLCQQAWLILNAGEKKTVINVRIVKREMGHLGHFLTSCDILPIINGFWGHELGGALPSEMTTHSKGAGMCPIFHRKPWRGDQCSHILYSFIMLFINISPWNYHVTHMVGYVTN